MLRHAFNHMGKGIKTYEDWQLRQLKEKKLIHWANAVGAVGIILTLSLIAANIRLSNNVEVKPFRGTPTEMGAQHPNPRI